MKNQFQQMTVAISLVCAGGVSASVMSFTNPAPGDLGHVDWEALTLLDITKPPSQQVGLANGFEVRGTFKFRIVEEFDVFTGRFSTGGLIDPGFGGRIFREVQPNLNVGIGFLQPGDIVGPGGAIPQGAGGGVYEDVFINGVLTGSLLAGPLGESFLGVSFSEVDSQGIVIGFHMGWIGFNLFENPDGTHGVDVTRWGYETTIDTAITIPTPSALPLFAAAALLTSRRRRYDC